MSPVLPALLSGSGTAVTGDPAVIRAVGLFAPLFAALALAAVARPSRVDTAASIVATAWSGVGVFALNLIAIRLHWWTFAAEGAVVQGIPVDLWLGWAVLWGALPALLVRDLPLPLVVSVLAWIDLLLMPSAGPVVRLGPDWLIGETAGVVLCLLPAVLLAHWTRQDRLRTLRMWAHVALAATTMVIIPLYLLGPSSAWPRTVTMLGVQLLLLLLVPGIAAAREFAAAGRGTPLPCDPPKRLVTSGPYAYVRNPMQCAIVAAYLCCAVVAMDAVLVLGAAVAFAYGAGFSAWHEDERLRQEFGAPWLRYRSGVRPWIPRLRPWPGRSPAVLYVAAGCGM